MFMSISFRRLTHLILLSILTVILVSACNTTNNTSMTRHQQPVENCRIVQHVMGETCVPRNPQRVVSLSSDTTANCWALGIRPIASAYSPGFPAPKYLQGKVDRVKSLGNYNAANLEKILSLKPDLILARPELESVYQQLSHIAPTVVVTDPAPWIDIFSELATVLDKEEVGKQLLNRYWQRVEKLKQDLGVGAASPKENHRKTIEISVANTSLGDGIWAYGEGHFSGSVLKDIGLQRPPAQKRGDLNGYIGISKEKLSDIDGDVLFFVSWERKDDRKALEKLKQSPLWSQLEVVQKNKVYLVGTHWHNPDIFAINAILDDLEKYLVNTP
jgi:iron complex transport system substrate-binding protein